MDQVRYNIIDFHTFDLFTNCFYFGNIKGQTSSQAQIGFKPESGSNNRESNIFNGGGQASAQSGVHSGQTQSQIQGNFK